MEDGGGDAEEGPVFIFGFLQYRSIVRYDIII